MCLNGWLKSHLYVSEYVEKFWKQLWWVALIVFVYAFTQTQDIFSLADTAWKHHKNPCFCILPLDFEVNIAIHKHENSEGTYSNRNKSQKEISGNSRLQNKNMENMLIDFIWLNVQAKYLIQTILGHFKWHMALWKWPKCPQYMQRTW